MKTPSVRIFYSINDTKKRLWVVDGVLKNKQ